MGMVDDFLEVSAVVKFFVLMAATGFLVYNGIVLTLFGGNLWLNIVCTLFWVVFVMSAFNAEDNMDGLAAGLALIASIFVFLLAWPTWQRWLSFLAVAIGGSCLGFLRYNRHPARIFMGDTGSFFLGFVLASTTVLGQWSEEPVKAIIMPLLILWVPLFDLTMITVLRWRAGKIKALHEILTLSDKDHLSHRLVALGLSQDRAVDLIYLMAILGGSAALAVQWLTLWACWTTVALCSTLAVLGTWWLDRATSHRLVSPEGSGSESGRPV
ncbi:MAG: undecaprenyl/decaprenyl-phosphate alpha-N-acetylglucosaminyl 1-phosphate transferase [Armatimonadetes bacterium]|nr:undecaprenyl/decaprenyl-phosphate alpha-N-acetylglucosaminyl 1-phosphate transferase [Armatimonadota bacterium]